jgi:hypothetical protein
MTMSRVPLAVTAAALSFGALGCCGSCPTSPVAEVRAEWERQLMARTVLVTSPARKVPIKRDVRSFVITADPAPYAAAFAKVIADKKSQFGLIQINRLEKNEGKPFTKGERFQGRYKLDQAVMADMNGEWKRLFGELLDDDAIQEWLCTSENQHASDYGEVVDLVDQPPAGEPYMFRYRYLSGSPIAGSSTYVVAEVTDPKDIAKHCPAGAPCKLSRLTQIFIYQEQSEDFAKFFAVGGLNLHNDVVLSQVTQAAALVPGAKVVASEVPQP